MISEIILSTIGGIALCIYLFHEHKRTSTPCDSCSKLVMKRSNGLYKYECRRNGCTYEFNGPPEICGYYSRKLE